jgi:hypothetical protein
MTCGEQRWSPTCLPACHSTGYYGKECLRIAKAGRLYVIIPLPLLKVEGIIAFERHAKVCCENKSKKSSKVFVSAAIYVQDVLFTIYARFYYGMTLST